MCHIIYVISFFNFQNFLYNNSHVTLTFDIAKLKMISWRDRRIWFVQKSRTDMPNVDEMALNFKWLRCGIVPYFTIFYSLIVLHVARKFWYIDMVYACKSGRAIWFIEYSCMVRTIDCDSHKWNDQQLFIYCNIYVFNELQLLCWRLL